MASRHQFTPRKVQLLLDLVSTVGLSQSDTLVDMKGIRCSLWRDDGASFGTSYPEKHGD